MKKLTSLLSLLACVAGLTAMAQADDMTITIKKATDTKAKVEPVPNSKGMSAMVPIMFDSGADWSNLKDTYTVSSDTASDLMHHKDTISIGTDGTASFHAMKMKKMKM